MRFWPLSIRWKFIITIIAFTLLLAIPFGFLTVKRLSDSLEDATLAGWQTGMNFAGRIMIESLLSWSGISPEEQKLRCQRQIKNLTKFLPIGNFEKNQAFLLYVQVVKLGQEVCHESVSTSPSEEISLLPPVQDLPVNLQKELLQNGKENIGLETNRVRNLELGEYLDFKYSRDYVLYKNDPQFPLKIIPLKATVDYLRVGVSLAPAQQRLRREATIITLIVLGYVLVGILIAFAFSKMILGPVEVLAKAVSRFRQDRSARAKVKSGDELEWLAQEFNKMADAIEERRRELERINAALLKANRVKSEFLAVMGHELKTPLHAIRGYTQLLIEGVDGPLTQAQQDDLSNILQSGDHLLELIDNILRFSKLEAGEEKLYVESVRASDLVEDAIKNINSLVRGKGLQLRIYSEPIPIMCDRTKVRQILINLLSNAVKHTLQGKIEVVAEQKDNTVRFTVTDTGVGIPAEYHEKIFEPFTQVDSSTTRESQGVGLGLAIVKKYVEMHGGRVGVESQPGKGSTFFFSIPLTPQLSANGLPAKEETNANPDRRGRSELTQSTP